MELLTGLSFAVICAASTMAVFSHAFDDNLLQRIGLSGAAIGAALKIAALVQASETHAPGVIMSFGAAVYAVGCVYAHLRKHS